MTEQTGADLGPGAGLDAEVDPADARVAGNFGTRELTEAEYVQFAAANRADLDRVYAAREADEAYAGGRAPTRRGSPVRGGLPHRRARRRILAGQAVAGTPAGGGGGMSQSSFYGPPEVGHTGPQAGDAGIGADGREYVYEPDGWQPLPDEEAEAGG